MTNKLPYSDLFPYIHPLGKRSMGVDVPPYVRYYIKKHYDFILPEGYLNADKIQKSLAFLNEKYPGVDILNQARQFINSILGDDIYHVPEHDEKATSYFWVYTVVAFLFLNQYQTEKSSEITESIRRSFDAARTHKSLWQATYGQRKGAACRAGKYATVREAAYKRWLTFSNKTKNTKAFIAAYELQQIPELFSGLKTPPTIKTLEKWVREWKRE